MTGGEDIPGSGPNPDDTYGDDDNRDDASIDRAEDIDFDDDSGSRPGDGTRGLTPPVKPQLDETERQP
jgi:hypothetical protein